MTSSGGRSGERVAVDPVEGASSPPLAKDFDWSRRWYTLRPRLVSIARRVVRNGSEAEDVADEALARLVREERRSEAPRNPAAWLHRTVLRIAIDRARMWVRRQRDLESVARRPRAAALAPEEEAMRTEKREAVWRSVLTLPRRQQEVIVLHEMEGLPYSEVAGLLEMEVATARAHAHAARENLRSRLARWTKDQA